MKLSIVVPIYNTEEHIKKCLLSLLKKRKDYEIILINDGSTDNSLNICNEVKNNNPEENIKIIDTINMGVSNARNLGIQNSSGDYIMFVDSDDYLLDNWADICLNINENADIIYLDEKMNLNVSKEQIISYILGNNSEKIHISGPISKLFKKEFLIQNNICFEKNIINGEDMLFNFECILKCKDYKIINQSFYVYNLNEHSVTRNFDDRIFDSEMLFQKKLEEILHSTENSFKNEYIDWCNGNHIITILNRLSYIENYFNAKVYYRRLEEQQFKDIICSKSKYKYRKIVFRMLRLKLYFIVYMLYKIKNKK